MLASGLLLFVRPDNVVEEVVEFVILLLLAAAVALSRRVSI